MMAKCVCSLASAVLSVTLMAQGLDVYQFMSETRKMCEEAEALAKSVREKQQDNEGGDDLPSQSSSEQGGGVMSDGAGRGAELLRRFFIEWNADDKNAATNALARVIRIADNDRMLGRNCSYRMKTLLGKAQNGGLPSKFDEQDYSSNVANNLLAYVYKPVWDRHNEYCDSTASRFRALGAAVDAESAVYRKQGEIQAFQAMQGVKDAYLKETGDLFDPSDRPAYSSGKCASWDKAKRIYDIFAK